MKLFALTRVARALGVTVGPMREAALRKEFLVISANDGSMKIPETEIEKVQVMAKAGCFSQSPHRREQALATFTFDDTAIPESIPELVTA